MSTNWTAVAGQDSVDQLDSKIGNSTDGESQPTVFGKLLGIRNVVDWVKTTWTATKAGLLDAAISSRAPASTALSTATWTATRAGKLDNLDGKISDVGRSLSKKLVLSDNVRHEVKNLSFSFIAAGATTIKAGVIMNELLKHSGLVRIKIDVASGSQNTSVMFFHPSEMSYSAYQGNRNTILDIMTKPPGTLTGNVLSSSQVGNLVVPTPNFGSQVFDLPVVKDNPLLLFYTCNQTTNLKINSVQVCYDEVAL